MLAFLAKLALGQSRIHKYDPTYCKIYNMGNMVIRAAKRNKLLGSSMHARKCRLRRNFLTAYATYKFVLYIFVYMQTRQSRYEVV